MMTKKYYILMMVALLSLTASAAKRQGTVWLSLVNDNSSKEIEAVAIFDDEANTVTLGNGYNACISHFEEGILTIPDIILGREVVIGPMAFRFCSYLTEVRVGKCVTTIGAYAFVGCSKLHTVRLPYTLTTIGSGAFSELPSLKHVYCNATAAPTWQWNDVFSALGTKASLATKAAQRFLYVPKGSLDSYMTYRFDGTATDAHEMVGWADAFTRIYEKNDDSQTISSLDDLIDFRDAVNTGGLYKGSTSKSVTQTADIDMISVSNWTPIGTGSEHPFNGTFNGDGHVIKNLKVDLSATSNSFAGLFGYTSQATIYNLHLMNPVVKGDYAAGAVAGIADNKSRIADVLVTSDVENDFTVSANSICGGITGSSADAVFERCLFRGRVKGEYCGGIVGWGGPAVTVIDCSADNEIKASSNGVALGGIVGQSAQVTLNRCLARNNFDKGNTSATTGWLVGKIEKATEATTNHITNSTYWNYNDAISMANTGADITLNEADNQPYSTMTSMRGEATKPTLGDGWHYFTGMYTDYPIPVTLLDMYTNHVVYGTTSDGLVFAPIGDLDSFTQYQVVGYTGTAKSVTIPAEFNDKPVAAIGKRAFYGSDIEAIDMGSVEIIDESAFEECDAMQTVSLPNTVTTVCARAFWNCDNLTSFTIGRKFQHHDGNFLAYCHKLQSLTVGSDGNGYGYLCQDNVLIHNTNNTTFIVACAPGKTGRYTIPTFSGYDYIHLIDNCFEGCTGLTSITFPVCVCYLPNGVFNGLTNLHYIDMNDATACNADNTDRVYYTVGHSYKDNPFYGTNKATIIYLKSGHSKVSDFEYNVVIGGSAYYLRLTDGWDFYPPTDISSKHGVIFDRTLQATRTEITRPTGNKVTLKDENDQDVEVDELEVTGYTYTPCGYSVCLPYDLTLNAENAKVFKPTAIVAPEGSTDNDLHVTFTEVTDKEMEAYRPYYIVVSGEEEVKLSTTGNTLIPNAITAYDPQAVGSDFEFKGTTVAISNAGLYDADKPVYILQSDGNWHKVPANTEDAYVPSFRAYFQADNAKTANQLITILNVIELSDILDNSAVLANYAGQNVSVTLQGRTLYKDGGWNTICLPFSLTAEQVSSLLENPTGLKQLQSSSFANGVLTLNFADITPSGEQEGLIIAGVPYLIKWDSGDDIDNPTFENVTINNTTETTTSTTYVDFVGSFSPVSFIANDMSVLFLSADNTLYYPNANMTVGSCRAYFKLNGITAGDLAQGAKSIVLNFGDSSETTGIISIGQLDNLQSDNWYDLSGRKIVNSKSSNSKLPKGIYINNGRKIVIK